MNIKINRNIQTPIYIQIKNEIRKKIQSDEIPVGFKLPPERQLAADSCVSRNTVAMAYQELIAEGLVVSSAKPKGYFVREPVMYNSRKIFSPLSKMIKYNYTDNENLFEYIFSQSNTGEFISFAGITIDPKLLSDDDNRFKLLEQYDNGETDRLKKNICGLLRKQNIVASEKNIQIVSETTQALHYIIDLYLNPGDCVVVEEPVVSSTTNIFRNNGISVVCAKMTDKGMNLEDLENLIRKYHPKFIYTMPNLHNPTGISMPLDKRFELLRIAHNNEIPIIEENSLRDFRYEGLEYPSLYSLDRYCSVLYLDTFTLTFLPGIKTAFIVGPAEPISMIGKLIVTNQTMLYNIGHSLLNESIESGTFGRRILHLQEQYRQKRDYFCEKLDALRCKGISFDIPEGGLFIWCKLSKQINEKILFNISKSKGLLYMPGNVFFPDGYSGNGYIRLCFSNVSNEDIDEGVRILDEALIISTMED